MLRIAAFTLMTLLITACGSVRPKQPPDALNCGLERFVVNDLYDQWRIYRYNLLSTQALSDAKPSFNVLTLSAGGEFGAYGAAFLAGWGSVGSQAIPSARNDVQVVTGVSTGAILATHAFLAEDQAIEDAYRHTSGINVYRDRPLLDYLWANSLLDAAGKDALIKERSPSSLIQRVAEAEGRFLYIGVVDLDSGRFLRIDMVALARTITPVTLRDDCYRAVIGASSAIPIAFSPKFIDGMMLVDGGARRHMFLTELADNAKKSGMVRRLYSFVHGDLDVGCTETKNGVLQIAARTAALFTDQGFKDSIRLTHQLASEPVPSGSDGTPTPLFETYYAAAAAAARVCAPKRAACQTTGGVLGEDQFCNAFMSCLADEGRRDGVTFATTGKWLSFGDLNLSSQPSCMHPGGSSQAPEPQAIRTLAQ